MATTTISDATNIAPVPTTGVTAIAVQTTTDVVTATAAAIAATTIVAVTAAVSVTASAAVAEQTQISSHPPIHTVFFDLDNTLYAKSTGVDMAMHQRIGDYMTDVLHIPLAQADQERTFYYKEYGLTLKGLQKHYHVEAQNYLDYVHGGLELSKMLKPDPELRVMLKKMRPDIKKWVFSNADLGHCNRVIKALDIDGIFDGVLDYLQMVEDCKPSPKSYELAILCAGATDYTGCVFLDDSVANLISAKEKGMMTVLVGSKITHPSVDYCIENVREFEQVFPELFAK